MSNLKTKLYPFLKENISVLQEGKSLIYDWMRKQTVVPDELNERLIINQWDMVDWALPTGAGMMEAMGTDKSHYQSWLPRDKADTSATLIIGSNLGYGINHILMNTPDTHKVLVLEPRMEMLLATLGQTDYRPFFQARKLFFVPPVKEMLYKVIAQLDLQYVYGRILLRTDLPSMQLGPEYDRWANQCREVLENFAIELNTLREKQDVMVGHELKNFARAMHDGSMLPLLGKAQGVGSVILGAGPSLARFAPFFNENRGYCLYATALQTLPAVHRHGLKPDFCAAIDYSEGMLNVYGRLDREWARDIPLIYSTKVDPRVIEAYPGPTLPLWTIGGIGTYVMSGEELVLDAGGNVSVALLRLLYLFGVRSVLLVGQDFAWSGERSHAEGHHGNVSDAHRVELRNKYGETIYSAVSYLTALRDMELDIGNYGIPVYNMYAGGAVIKGARDVSENEVLLQGLNSSEAGCRERFLQVLQNEAGKPRAWPKFPVHSLKLNAAMREGLRLLEKFFKKPEKNQESIHSVLKEALSALRDNIVYNPYLFNEIMDLAGLVHARNKYLRPDIVEIRNIWRRIQSKTREMDDCVTERAV